MYTFLILVINQTMRVKSLLTHHNGACNGEAEETNLKGLYPPNSYTAHGKALLVITQNSPGYNLPIGCSSRKSDSMQFITVLLHRQYSVSGHRLRTSTCWPGGGM